LFNLSDLTCYKSATLWSKSYFNHKGNRATFKAFFFACSIIVFQVLGGFSFPPFDCPPPPTLEGHIWLISSCFSSIQLSVGAQIVGLKFLFGHEIQRSTLHKFAHLWDIKCSVTGLATLCSSPQCVWLQVQTCFVLCTFYGRFKVQTSVGRLLISFHNSCVGVFFFFGKNNLKLVKLSMSISKTNLNAH
jgi:hypothetical protein